MPKISPYLFIFSPSLRDTLGAPEGAGAGGWALCSQRLIRLLVSRTWNSVMTIDKINQTVTLKDGKRIGFAEYGAPSGRPVFHFHGSGASRLDRPSSESMLLQLDIRFISVDRPGHGLSDFQPKRPPPGLAPGYRAVGRLFGNPAVLCRRSFGRRAARFSLRPAAAKTGHRGRGDQQRCPDEPAQSLSRHAGDEPAAGQVCPLCTRDDIRHPLVHAWHDHGRC